MYSNTNLPLPEFFAALKPMSRIDAVDWQYACWYAEKWKMSVADTLLDLCFVDESTIAQALAKAHSLQYVSGQILQCDFSEIDFETFNDLISVGAVPLSDNKLAICNPYDDLRGNLNFKLCQRQMVVTERSYLFDALRKQGLSDWLGKIDNG